MVDTFPAVTVHIFDSMGRRLGMWEAGKTGGAARQMPFNGPQSLSINVPRPYASAEMCAFGNLCVIESSSGVELWGGVVRGPRRWTLAGPSVTIQSWETFLQDLFTPRLVSLRGLTVGAVIEKVLSDALAAQPSPLAIGNVADIGGITTHQFRSESVLGIIQSLRTSGGRFDVKTGRFRSATGQFVAGPSLEDTAGEVSFAAGGFDWWCETVWDDNESHPHGVFHLQPRAGRDSGVVLSEGVNVASVDFTEDDAAAVTRATVIGNSPDNWGERPSHTVADPALSAQLGWPRVAVAVRTDLRDYEAVRAAAAGMVAGVQSSLVVGVTNKRGEWASIRNGDTVWVDLPSFTFAQNEGPLPRRVIGRTVDEVAGVQTLQLTDEG